MARILVVDDDQLIRRSLIRLFKDSGHEVVEASTLHQGVQAAEDGVDVIYLDLGLPDGDGLKAIDQLASVGSRPEIIVITGKGSMYGAEKSMDSSVWDYIQKPASPQQVLESLEGALAYRAEKKISRGSKIVFDSCGMVGESFAMSRAFAVLGQAAASNASVLVRGETGVGKELAARAIHVNSARKHKPFVVVDCSNLAESLIESTLYGHVKGAYTGAQSTKEGLVAEADGGTLFLDEVGELPIDLQKSLLRVLQERRYRPVGSSKELKSDFRLVAATNRDLVKMCDAGSFRSDLLFRLRTVEIVLPPLRERESDIETLTSHFIRQSCDRYGLELKAASEELSKVVHLYDWPGNVRELMNVLEASVIQAGSVSVIYPRHLPSHVRLAFLRESARQGDASAEDQKDISPLSHFELQSYSRYKAESDRNYFEKLMVAADFDVRRVSELSELSVASVYRYLAQVGISTKKKGSGGF
ncbi:sigma-54-dependent transcriptional regulator [Desulfosediminicola sp.]|uniref:sigma-54-dependent transcriptional regulator n=1 Tax=Desulfosediminicola sp. TaxID=2886825 RepID=UPI003AF281A8